MGECIDLLVDLPKSKRPLEERAMVSEEDKILSKKLGKEYFDGTRAQGYGGYYYDGRWKPVARRLAKHYKLKRGSRVLDIGCAKGFLLQDFLEEVPGIEIAGLDISEYALRNSSEHVRPYLYLGNAKELPFPNDSFDLVISICSLHNIMDLDETEQSLREIQRVTKQHSYIKVGAYHNEEEKRILDHWAVVSNTYLHCDDWVKLFEKASYVGDYFWFHPSR